MKEYVKEIWIRFSSQEEYLQNEERLLAVIDEAPGDCMVKIYDTGTRQFKTLRGHSFDEKQLSLLTDLLGKDNARYQEREIEVRQQAQMKTPNIVQIIPCTHDMYAVFNDDAGRKCKYKVLLFALCDDGEVYPLHFDNLLGTCLLDVAVCDVTGYELEGGEICE